MSLKDDFLKIKTYEEYDQKREAFKDLDYSDKEIFEHWGNLFPKLKKSGWEDGIIVEAYKGQIREHSKLPPVRNDMVVFVYQKPVIAGQPEIYEPNSAELLSYIYIDRRIFRVAFRVAFSPKIVLFNIKI